MNKHILVVDDDEQLLKLMEIHLKQANYNVTTSVSPLKSITLFKENSDKFDLIITDLRMSEMYGDSFSSEILKINPDIPIFLFTGYNTIELKEKAKFLKIKEVIEKPIRIKEIVNKIKTYLIR